mmetsp:Transcript_91441/g.229827  ORF Transcript_91441/g.229827 Transcript_91441/m.229827 type:complete len:225 (-) Transcript_91441:362-1036(-)
MARSLDAAVPASITTGMSDRFEFADFTTAPAEPLRTEPVFLDPTGRLPTGRLGKLDLVTEAPTRSLNFFEPVTYTGVKNSFEGSSLPAGKGNISAWRIFFSRLASSSSHSTRTASNSFFSSFVRGSVAGTEAVSKRSAICLRFSTRPSCRITSRRAFLTVTLRTSCFPAASAACSTSSTMERARRTSPEDFTINKPSMSACVFVMSAFLSWFFVNSRLLSQTSL